MELFKKDGNLLYVQADHVTGELLGSVIEYLYEAGACNVQVIPTVTKKNRPGYIFLIDVKSGSLEKVEQVLIRELSVTGWHRIHTEHCHLAVDYLKKQVEFRMGQDRFCMEVEGKKTCGIAETLRPEHRSCAELKEILRSRGKDPALETCKKILTEILEQDLSVYSVEEAEQGSAV